MLGYKGFDADLNCLGFRYEIGKTYTMDSQDIKLCEQGFHFCRIPIDVFRYYYKPYDKYAIVQAQDKIIDDVDKSVTNHLTIVKLITKEELIQATNGLFVRHNGDKEWYQNGVLQRTDKDLNGFSLPAKEYVNGTKKWYQNGRLHRLDGPACEYSTGERSWYKNGQLHRKNGPAIECANGDKYWYQNGKLHREDGPAIEYVYGGKYWYQNDLACYHKDGTPAEASIS